MSVYFFNFPIVQYNGVSARDITRRTNFIESVLSNPYVFLPYTVKEGEKPEDIAYNYYGTVAATWLVLMANKIVDPYTQWPLSYENFIKYIIMKYEVQSGKTGYDVVAWTQDQTSLDNVLYYYTKTDSGLDLKTSPNTFPFQLDNNNNIIGREVPLGWLPMRIYDHENLINEQKREILVVERQYYEQINKEFKELIKK